MSPIPVDPRTPVDYIEPEIDMRNASLAYVNVLQAFANRVGDALRTGDIRAANTAFWGSAYGLGLKICGGMSMSKRASFVGVTRATISKVAQAFVEDNGLPPSLYMKDAASHRPYAIARRSYVANGSKPKPSL